MTRYFLCAMSVGLVALSWPALAGSDDVGKIVGSDTQAAPTAPAAGPRAPAAIPAGPLSISSEAGSANPGQTSPLALAAPVDVDNVPVLKHIAATGAQLLDLGEAHGLRSVSARSGEQFMILQIAPDGQAVVGGPQLDLAVDKLMVE